MEFPDFHDLQNIFSILSPKKTGADEPWPMLWSSTKITPRLPNHHPPGHTAELPGKSCWRKINKKRWYKLPIKPKQSRFLFNAQVGKVVRVNVFKCNYHVMNWKFCQEFEYHISNFGCSQHTIDERPKKTMQHWLSGCTWHMAVSYIGDTCRIIEGNIWTQTLHIFGLHTYLLPNWIGQTGMDFGHVHHFCRNFLWLFHILFVSQVAWIVTPFQGIPNVTTTSLPRPAPEVSTSKRLGRENWSM